MPYKTLFLSVSFFIIFTTSIGLTENTPSNKIVQKMYLLELQKNNTQLTPLRSDDPLLLPQELIPLDPVLEPTENIEITANNQSEKTLPLVKVILKNGQLLEGNLLELTDDSVKILDEIPLTLYRENIYTVNGNMVTYIDPREQDKNECKSCEKETLSNKIRSKKQQQDVLKLFNRLGIDQSLLELKNPLPDPALGD